MYNKRAGDKYTTVLNISTEMGELDNVIYHFQVIINKNGIQTKGWWRFWFKLGKLFECNISFW